MSVSCGIPHSKAQSASTGIRSDWVAGSLIAPSCHNGGSDWPGKFAAVPWVYGEIVRTLARYEPVFIIIRDAKQKEAVKSILDRVHADRLEVLAMYDYAIQKKVRRHQVRFVLAKGGNDGKIS